MHPPRPTRLPFFKAQPRRRATLLAALGSACFALFASTPASAQTNYTWNSTSGGTGAWTVSANWTPNTGTPGGNAGDTATIGQSSTSTSSLELVTLGDSTFTLSSITLNQSSTGTVELRLGGSSSTSTVTVGNTLNLGGNATGTELLYIDTIDNTKSAVYSGNISVGSHGVIEMGSSSNSPVPTIIGNVEIGAGGNLNLDRAIANFNPATINGNLTLDNTGTMTFGTTNSGGVSASGTDIRFNVQGTFLAKTGSTIAETATPSSTNVYDIHFSGTSSTATFQSGVTGGFITNYTNSSESMSFDGTSTSFSLATDVNLPTFNIIPASTAGLVTVTVGSISGGAANMSNIFTQAPVGGGTTSAPTGTLQLNLGTNVNTAFLQPSNRGGAGNTIIVNLGGHTLASAHSEGLGNTSGATNWEIEGTSGGVFSSPFFTFNGATGANGNIISGPITILANASSGTNDLGNANGTIDPASTFAYTGTVSGSENLQVTGGRSIGRVAVGATTGAITNTLTLTSAVTSAGDVTVNAKGTLLLGGFNLTESHAATSNAGGLSGANGAVVANSVGSGTNTLTLDTTGGNGSFGGLIEDHVSGGTGTLALAVGGTGSQTLTGTNTYSGGTTVNGGVLYANTTGSTASSTGTGAVTVNGGSLAGLGAIRPNLATGVGITVASGGNIAPGGVQTNGSAANGNLILDPTHVSSGNLLSVASSASLTSPELTFALGTGHTSSEISVAGAAANVINFNAGGTAGSSSVISILDLTGASLQLNTEYVLIAGNGSTTYLNNGSALTLGAPIAGLGSPILDGLSLLPAFTAGNNFSFNYGASRLFLNGDNIEVEIIPEPSTWAMMLGGLALLLFWQRRRTQDSRR